MPVLGMAQELKVLKVGQLTVAEVIRCLPLRGADPSKTDEGGFPASRPASNNPNRTRASQVIKPPAATLSPTAC